ncbi:hypothetical protein [Vreelandella alkaliphila]|uniref:Uncharacterized protein n=1 Tax=Vreelandella alkaliphila TaxID=272774 RepID=A0A7C9JSY9_9GAMM|nr:hypothetical protein [Halomonas alkaliphila]NDL70905.1 hypothetical protein [Halomonas alkaliphila]
MANLSKRKQGTPESQRLKKEITRLESKIERAYLAGHDEYATRLEAKVTALEERSAEIKALDEEKAREEKRRKYWSRPAQVERPGKKPMLCTICGMATTPADSEVVDKARLCLGCLAWKLKAHHGFDLE